MTPTMNDELGMTNDKCHGRVFHSSFVIRHSSFLSLLTAVLLFINPALLGQTQSEDTLIKEALTAYQSGRLDAAIRNLSEAHRIAPANSYASLYLGLMLNQKDPD